LIRIKDKRKTATNCPVDLVDPAGSASNRIGRQDGFSGGPAVNPPAFDALAATPLARPDRSFSIIRNYT
jgi:hypothetical protein